MPTEILQFADMGGTAALAGFVIWLLIKNRKNDNGKKLERDIRNLRDNHLGEISQKLDTLINQGYELDRKQNETIKILTRIEAKQNAQPK